MKPTFRFAEKLICAALSMSGALLLSSCMTTDSSNGYMRFHGAAASPSSANRVINIGLDTRYVNVTQGDIVKFVVGDKMFAWNFDVTSKMWEMDLDKLAPVGTLNHNVKVYIEPNRIYDGGG